MGTFVDKQACPPLLYNDSSVSLAHGLDNSGEGLRLAVLLTVTHKCQRPLLKVSSSNMLSFVVCCRCEPQQWFHCWLLWRNRRRSSPDGVFASGSSVQHRLPLCLQHETGDPWDWGGATSVLRLTSFLTSFWLIVDNWEEKKLAAGQSLGNHKDLTIHFFIFSNQPVYYFTEFGHWNEKRFTVPIFVFIRIFKIMFGLFTIWNWWEGLFSLQETWDDFSTWELFWPADVICVTEAPCCPSSHPWYF